VTPAQAGRAVRRVLAEPGFRARAGALRDAMGACDGPARSAELLERLCATARPVTREDYDAAAAATAGSRTLAGASS
jgi:hypothetical protein